MAIESVCALLLSAISSFYFGGSFASAAVSPGSAGFSGLHGADSSRVNGKTREQEGEKNDSLSETESGFTRLPQRSRI
jgi:hypothetical protein